MTTSCGSSLRTLTSSALPTRILTAATPPSWSSFGGILPSPSPLSRPPPPPPRFACALPPSWVKSHAKMEEFNSTPYISPYSEDWAVLGTDAEAEKRAVGVVHELLSLTLWKKMSVLKLEHFRREFRLPEDTARMLLRHPCIFCISNWYKIHTVVLREGYEWSVLKVKDPVVAAKDMLGELMQRGVHEYNQRRRGANLEKRRRGKRMRRRYNWIV